MTDNLPSRTWFDLARHDDPPVVPPADPPKPADDWETSTGKGGKSAVLADLGAEREKRKALEAQLAELTPLAQKARELEDAQRTEAEKLTAKAEAAVKVAEAATARAVKAEVKALADAFADREDAVLNLGDLSQYVADGDVNTDAITEALGKVLDRKPHLAKAAAGPRNPAPDPSQGRGGNNEPTDYRKASKAEADAEFAKYGIRPRSL